MTREEREKAIDALKISAPVMAVTQEEFNDYIQTLNKIMNWLEQVPCTDAISRQAAIDAFERFIHELGIKDEPYNYGEMALSPQNVPSVTPAEKVGQWIPVNERLPEKNVEVLVTTEWDCITIGEMFSNNDWFIHEGTTNADIDDIKAWMPLPKPYEVSPTGAERSDKE